MKPKIYDLTPKVSPRLAVFPGDQAFEREVAMSFAAGHHLELSAMRTTLHLGAHADAPSHYHAEGQSIAARPLKPYFGKAQVIRVPGLKPSARIFPADVKVDIAAPRVLFWTGSFADPETWRGDFNSLSPELLERLGRKGVCLVGIDTPSVDPADSKALEAHQILFKYDFAVLEGLYLEGVPEGIYSIMALPLPIVGGDASPVRAVLFPYVAALDACE